MPFGETSSTSVEQAWRTLPSTSIVHAPHDSSRQLASHTGGVTRVPSTVTGARRISARHSWIVSRGRHGTSNASMRRESLCSGPS